MQNRIDALREDLFKAENLNYSQQILDVVYDYLEKTYSSYSEDAPEDLFTSLYKIREASFFLAELE